MVCASEKQTLTHAIISVLIVSIWMPFGLGMTSEFAERGVQRGIAKLMNLEREEKIFNAVSGLGCKNLESGEIKIAPC